MKLRLDVYKRQELDGTGSAEWTEPNGGYFVSVDVLEGCAKRVVSLCKEAGVTLTGAGATYPYGKDPQDKNIRVAPTFPPVEELQLAMDLFCLCVKLAACLLYTSLHGQNGSDGYKWQAQNKEARRYPL